MRNNMLGKLKLTKRIFLFVLTLALTNCQDSENLTTQEQSNIKTVSINDAKAFLTKSTNNPSAKLASSEIGDLEFDKATLEKLNGSDQLLTVIPFATNNDVQNDRVLIVKIDDEIRSVIFRMQPDENSNQIFFSGKLLIYSLEGDFINGYGAKNGLITTQFVKSSTKITSKTIDGGQLNEVIIPAKPKLTNALSFDAIWGSGGSSMGYSPVGGASGVTWDASSGGGSGSASSPTVVVPPSCESFNFTSKKGANWQEAVVKNIYFRIVIIDEKGVYVNHVVSFPQGVLFGMPINFNKGNGDVTGGVAATVSAMVLKKVMDTMDKKYARTEVSDLILTTEFKSLLASEYRTYTNGGIVNFNSSSPLPATNYKTNPNQTGICD